MGRCSGGVDGRSFYRCDCGKRWLLTSASELDCWDNVPEYAFDVRRIKTVFIRALLKGQLSNRCLRTEH